MKKDKNLRERSPRIQEIMGKIPPWVVRWGMSVVFVVLFLLIFVSWVIKYPEKVNFIVKIKEMKRGGYYGEGCLREEDYVKIKKGMEVKIKLRGYPFSQYGILEGRIDKKKYDKKKGFMIKVNLNKGLRTTFKAQGSRLKIKYYEGMSGTGEITVSRKRLFKKLIKNIKR